MLHGMMDDNFDDIDDEALLQVLDASVVPPSPTLQALAPPSRPAAPAAYLRPTNPTTNLLSTQSTAATTVNRPTTVQQTSRGSSYKNPELFPSSSGGYSNITIQSAPSRQSSQNGSRSFQMYHGIPQPGSNGLMRQTTLMGGVGRAESPYVVSGRHYRNSVAEEPTHHELDREALKTWQYPMNLGNIREYQYTIVHTSLFHNTLVALPTGLGKTLIAATVMLNFYRWMKTAKLVFIAPTRPLVSQQVSACYEIAGIPRSDTTILMGTVKPALRAQEWSNRRVIFTTPQTLENDISRGYADPKTICLLVVDEAHRAVGNYSAAKACRKISQFNRSFRVLALTATPGSSVESVQDVINNLGISKVEIRTEESMDLRQYTHARAIDTHVVDYSDELATVRRLLTKALNPIVRKFSELNVYWGRDPMSLSAFTINKAKTDWFKSAGREANQGVKSTVMAIFNILLTIAHPIKLLNFHGIIPFYNDIQELVREVKSKSTKSKYKCALVNDPNFDEMLGHIEIWKSNPDFVDHPKLAALTAEIATHFSECLDPMASKVIVFSEFRDSTEHITDLLNRTPLVKAKAFVGQAASKSGAGGMKQADQIAAIDEFKKGKFNVLVATSIGEEGLDIGQVDLIVCYDASASPIRMLQRMGRTGRKRAGRVVLLLTRGKEEEKYEKANDAYTAMQRMIVSGETFEYRHDISRRIVPYDIKPTVDKRIIEIPIENTQGGNDEVDPNKRPGAKKPRKAPPKKFHMPDGVITGFMRASAVLDGETSSDATPKTKKPKTTKTKVRTGYPDPETESAPIIISSPPPARSSTPEADRIVDIPPLESVVLTPKSKAAFKRTYCTLAATSTSSGQLVIEEPETNKFPELQRELRPIWRVSHSDRTKHAVKLFKKLGESQDVAKRYDDIYDWHTVIDLDTISIPDFAPDPSDDLESQLPTPLIIPSGSLEYPKQKPVDLDDDWDLLISPPVKQVFTVPSLVPSHLKKPVALLPESPAHLYNFLDEDKNDENSIGSVRSQGEIVYKIPEGPPKKKGSSAQILWSANDGVEPERFQVYKNMNGIVSDVPIYKGPESASCFGINKTKAKSKGQKKTTKIKSKSKIGCSRVIKSKAFGDGELGDDCERTSDFFYSGEDDEDSDMADFIDDQSEEELEREDEFSDDPLVLSDVPKKRKKTATAWEGGKKKAKTAINSPAKKKEAQESAKSRTIRLAVEDSDDDDMPTLDHILKGVGKNNTTLPRVAVPEGRIIEFGAEKVKEKENHSKRGVIEDSDDYGLDEDLDIDGFDFDFQVFDT